MKKNILSLAVAASVAGTSAQAAMYLNPEGTGQVLLFPYYNAENGNETSIHIVNTTNDAKAVKVRILEYVNSQEVLDFNLYMSAEDHFAFTIFADPNGTGGALITRDNSCTVPALGDATSGVPGYTEANADGTTTRVQPFLPYAYADDAYDSIYRTKIGHVEVIEMGTLEGAWEVDATHGAGGVPADCAQLVANWSTDAAGVDGAWKVDKTNGIGDPTGGLYGVSNHLNNTDAAAYGIEAAAVADFWGSQVVTRHTDPGDREPNLASGDTSSLVPDAGAYETRTYAALEAVDSVSSLFMTASISNDVMLNPVLNGQTDWVITFPTKRYYVNGTVPREPFTEIYEGATGPNTACEDLTISQWDREEAYVPPADQSGGPQFSPKPPTPEVTPSTKPQLCYETNTIAAGAGASSALNATMSTDTTANAGVNLTFPYSEGWQRVAFSETGNELPASTGTTLQGLPAMGFAAFKYTNATSNYGFVSDHKTAVATS